MSSHPKLILLLLTFISFSPSGVEHSKPLKARLNKSLHKTQSLQKFLFYFKEYQLNLKNAKNAASDISLQNVVLPLLNMI